MTPELMEGRSAAPEGGAPPVGRLVDVSGRRLFVHTKGSGGPVVVILPGAGAIGLDYLNVFERIAEHPVNRIDELLPWHVARHLAAPALRDAA